MGQEVINLGKTAINLIFIITLFGCCNKAPNKNNDEQPKPIWTTRIIGDNTKYIYNQGLKNAPIYDNSIIFSTTITSNNQLEDNRLCGLDLDNGNIRWMFPHDKTTTYDYTFDNKGHIYNNYIVTRSRCFRNSIEKIVCIDLNNNNIYWEKEYPTASTYLCSDIIGINDKAYYSIQEKESLSLWIVDVINDIHTKIYNIPVEEYLDGDLMIYEDKLLFITMKDINVISSAKLNIYSLSTNKIVNKITIPVNPDGSFGANNSFIVNNKVYYNSGNSLFCADIVSGKIVWEEHITKTVDYVCTDIYLYEDKILHFGNRLFKAHNIDTGEEIFENSYENTGITWAFYNNNYLYMNLYGIDVIVIDANSGVVVAKLICPLERGEKGEFHHQPGRVLDNKLYLLSNTSVYCYPTYPWN